ncbi:glycosyltransferase [Belliella baltica]|uniref:glycosyltransferase n=1 Tax=Belliella baltica TaxID=232259 RepID=UPI0003047C32|nr:glycosyltransferase [Belliella baltica]
MKENQKEHTTQRKPYKIDYRPFVEPELDARYYLQLPPDKEILTMMAPLKAGFGHFFFLKVATRVSEIFPNTHFLIVSEEVDINFEKELKSKKSELGLKGKLDIVKTKKDIPDALKASNLFFQPETEATDPSMVLLKAMATGLPVISTKSETAEMIIIENETGFLVNKDDLENTVEKISIIINDQSLAKKMGKSGQERVIQHFSI